MLEFDLHSLINEEFTFKKICLPKITDHMFKLFSLLSLAWKNNVKVAKLRHFDILNLLGPVAVLKMVWKGWVAVSLKFHQAVTPVPSTLPAIVIPGLFQLSYGRNVPLHEKRSLILMACHGSSPVLSQGCQDMGMLSHARSRPPFHHYLRQGGYVFSHPCLIHEVIVVLYVDFIKLPSETHEAKAAGVISYEAVIFFQRLKNESVFFLNSTQTRHKLKACDRYWLCSWKRGTVPTVSLLRPWLLTETHWSHSLEVRSHLWQCMYLVAGLMYLSVLLHTPLKLPMAGLSRVFLKVGQCEYK